MRTQDFVITNITQLSDSCPMIPEDHLNRENYISHIEGSLFSNRILCVNGVSEGVGVTTLLTLFAYKHSNECISVFNREYTTAFQTIGFIEQSIVKQLNFYLYNTICDTLGESLTRIKWKVCRKLNNSRNRLYFIFDGYNTLSKERKNSLRKLLGDLYTIPNSYFLFSGNKTDIESLFPKDSAISQVDILPFSDGEVNSYFSKAFPNAEKEELAVITKISKGIGSRMCVLKTQINQATSIGEYLLNDINENTDLLEDTLGRIVHSSNINDGLIFSLLTYSEIPLSISAISSIINIPQQEVIEILERYDDLVAKSTEGIVSLKSEILHKYLKNKLIGQKRTAVESLVAHITKFENVNQSFQALPNLLKEAHNDRAILEYIDSDTIRSFVKKEATQAIVNEHCDLGFSASSRYPDEAIDRAFRYAVYKSCSKEIEKNELWDSEIEALLSIGEYEEACALAQNVYLKEEQLKCFLLIARKKDKLPASLYDSIIANVTELINIIDFEHIPNKSIELAKLLLPIDINQALTIIERVEKANKGKINLDKLYSALSLSFEETASSTTSANKDVLQSKIADEGLRQLSSAMRKIFGNCDEERLIEELDKLSSDFHRLYLLQYWIPEHKELSGIGRIIVYALKIIIRISDIDVPKASFVKKICSPLPKISTECLSEIVALLDSMKESIIIPSSDYVETQISLCSALFPNFQSEAEVRLIDLYFFIDGIKDLSVKTHCLALLLSSYDRLGDKKVIDGILDSALDLQKIFNKSIDELLNQSAYHLHAVDGAIRALAVDYPSSIKETIGKLNTLERRSRAYFVVSDEYLSRIEMDKIEWGYLFNLIQNITYNIEDKDAVLTTLVRKLYLANDASIADIKTIKRIYSLVSNIEEDDRKIQALTLLWVLLNKQYISEVELIKKVKSLIEEAWMSMDIQWLKINIGFDIVKYIAKISIDEAKEFLLKVVSLKKDNLLSTTSCISAYMECLFIYTQSLGTLIRSNLVEEKHISQFQQMIDYINSGSLSIVLWSKVAIEYLFAGQKDEYNRIVGNFISIPIEGLSRYFQRYVLFHSAPSRYLSEGTKFLDSLMSYGEAFRNNCIENISKVILYKSPYTEYFDPNLMDFQINNEDTNHLCQLMLASSDENFIFNTIEIICRNFEDNRSNYSEEQKKYLWEQLNNIINSKLPSPTGIQHKGYALASKCCLSGIAQFVGKQVKVEDIIKEIDSINNVADRAFLYLELANWTKKKDKCIEYLKSGYDLAQGISSLNDKLGRVSFCLEVGFSRSRNTAKSLAKDTIRILASDSHGTFSDVKGLIDLVNRYDADYTNELLDVVDTDPSRKKYRKQLEANITSTRRIEAASKNYGDITKLNAKERGEFFNQQLEGLISDKGTSHDPKESIDILKSIYDKPIANTYKAILVFIENVYKRHKILNRDGVLLSSIHESLFGCLQIILALASGTKEKLEYISRIISEDETDTADTIIRPGERDKAIQEIINWYKQTQPVSLLRIVDAYFSPADLQIIKPLFDFNTDLVVKILTHKTCEIEEYQAYWNRISTDLTGMITIHTVNYKDRPDSGPLHDRWWLISDEEENINGITSNSVSGLGNKESGIYPLEDENIKKIEKIWNDYVLNNRPRINGQQFVYDSVQLK
ncbi:hypothetical protein [Bacteroides acidifaciens]|uniref:hypothetical protein n=1 Tax=Bacteroides acidifaciens TaxID=85831 RepID=UPI00262495C7|nr:hypothetical protein [Bacteroides acidifaciens]